ncbi:MAG: nicotinate phosphoribosyltransferase [Actinomycetota bacterium]|nr:nicotinate phosphoribosyltransferase [Actinomycetota bacterium]
MPASTALLTDQYEITMLQAALRSGRASVRSTFEVFARRLPDGRRYGVVAGTGRVLDAIADFRFGADELEWLGASRVVDSATLDWLADYRFRGHVDGYAEGDAYFPGSPVLVLEGTFAECVVLETLVLSILNHDCAVASAASRMVSASGDRPCMDFGSRRTHEQAGVAAARAAYVAGFASTSNLEAGRAHGIPTVGTSAHAFTLLHGDEREAFSAQVASLGTHTTLLVDTYDTEQGIRNAVEVAGTGLGAIRLDSGDLGQEARDARTLLDSLGAEKTKIVVTSDLDEYAIAALQGAPVDAYGVGTNLVTGSGAPTAGFVYKLVARALDDAFDAPLLPVAKKSAHKGSRGGRPTAVRRIDASGVAAAEVVQRAGHPDAPLSAGPHDRPLLVPLVRRGEQVERRGLAEAREQHKRAMEELPPDACRLSRGEPVIDTLYES